MSAKKAYMLLAMCLPMLDVAAAEPPEPPLTKLSIEELLDIDVYSASKFLQKITEAPASVTIVSAKDIKRYGYRTLGDILRSVRGLFVTYDRAYQYVGVRGFNRPGDYNGRVLLLVDGYRLNDAVFDTAAIGTEFLLDVDLIDRVEVVRGPGSSIYGSNAVFGVVNVITKSGSDIGGAEVSGEAASFHAYKGRATFGRSLNNGAEVLFSASRFDSEGQDLYFPEFDDPATNGGVADALDGDRMDRLFAKASYGEFTLTAAFSERTKKVPTAAFETAFNDPRNEAIDAQKVLDLAHEKRFSERLEMSSHVYAGSYYYEGTYPYEEPPLLVVNKDKSWGNWWGLEARTITRVAGHRLLAGVEYQDNYRQDQKNFDIAPAETYLDDNRDSRRWAVYLEDEIAPRKRLLLNVGVRYDHYSTVGGSVNPRLALIISPGEETAVKLLYGTAFRAPNAFELYYADGISSKRNPGLDPEEISSYEIAVEHQPQPNLRFMAAVYRNDIRKLIDLTIDPADDLLVYRNLGEVRSQGAEIEAERAWADDTRLRASFALQNTKDRDSGETLVNSPRRLAKLNFTSPFFADALRAGVEVQHTGERKTLAGAKVGAFTLVNLTFLAEAPLEGMQISVSAYNLLDRQYEDPARPEHMQDALEQDGRNYRLKVDYHF